LARSFFGCNHNLRIQLINIPSAVVRQRIGLKIGPSILVGIKLRSIHRQIFHMNPTAPTQPLTKSTTLVSSQMIPDNNYLARQMPHKMTQKGNDLFLSDCAVHKELHVSSQPVTAGRDRQFANRTRCADDAESAAAAPASGREAPMSARPVGTRLVDENQACGELAKSMGTYLCGPTLDPRPAMPQPPLDGRFVCPEQDRGKR